MATPYIPRPRPAERLRSGFHPHVLWDPLIKALMDEDFLVRCLVALALAKLGDSRAVEPLEQAHKDATALDLPCIEEALKKMGDAPRF